MMKSNLREEIGENRNLVLNNGSAKWLTIPLKNKGNYYNKISDMEVSNINWVNQHLDIIKSCYNDIKDFREKYKLIEEIYSGCTQVKLSEINKILLLKICKLLDINTIFLDSSEIKRNPKDDPSEEY